jgi:hypothetical protein
MALEREIPYDGYPFEIISAFGPARHRQIKPSGRKKSVSGPQIRPKKRIFENLVG